MDFEPDAPRSASPRQARAMRERLLERVADADHSHLTVEADAGHWQAFVEGVRIKVLHEHEGVMSYLLRFAPGARLPPHRHPHDEECIVIEGRLRVGTRLEIGPGSYHLAHRGALHAGIVSTQGATVFLRGAVPDARDILGEQPG